MSSLKDIMDVDVEPLESQAYRRKEAAQQQASRPSLDPSSQSPSPQLDDIRGKSSVNRRRSNRVSKSATQSTSSRPSITRRRSSAAGEAMDFSAFQVGGSNQGSIAGSPLQQSSRGGLDHQLPDVPVKYTPVTGRISRAKKGMPVHTCDDCKPAKTFTRAEHLRRHKLSHGKPAYPCTFEDCERTFHRPDLLARHINRHETQGEKAYKSSDPRSRASSSASESAPMKLEPTSHGATTGLSPLSQNESLISRNSASSEAAVAPSFNTINNFPPINNFSQGGSSTLTAPTSSRAPSYGEMTSTFSVRPTGMSEISDQDTFRGASSGFEGLYSDGSASFTNYSTPQLPLLRIPEDPFMPGLSYTQDNSPWCSSASDSTYSTHSESSHTGRMAQRGRSGSLVTAPEWVPVTGTQWSPHGMSTTPQDLRSPPYEAVMDAYDTTYTPPRMSPPSRQLLDVPFNGGYYMESVGNPHPSTSSNHLAQTFPASSPRISTTRLAGFDRRSKDLVATQQLGTLMNIGTIMSTPSQSALSNINHYLSSYWNNFDKLYPFIHHPTYIPHQDSLLTFAMAAIGTQYCYNPEARKHGVELHAYCTNTISSNPNRTLQILQAILLTEIFTCFRGKKTTICLSRQFDELYSRLLNEPYQIPEIESTVATGVSDDLNNFNTQTEAPNIQSDWLQWVETESRHRLLNLCFIFDTIQAMYHQQTRTKPYVDNLKTMLYVPCPEFMWEATSAADWATNENRDGDYSNQSLHDAQQQLTLHYSIGLSHFTQILHICSIVSQLPDRFDLNSPSELLSYDHTTARLTSLFPASSFLCIYLALYYTPLRDLLVVTGDTWVFSKKMTQQPDFRAAQSRLRKWSSSLAGATATHYACRFLMSELSIPQNGSSSSDHVSQPISLYKPKGLSHYWSLNVAVLICWAFGHRVAGATPGNNNLNITTTNTTVTSHNLQPPTSSDASSSSSSTPAEKSRIKALEYAKCMLKLQIPDLLTNKASMRGQTSSVIDAVLERLQYENIGACTMSLVDSIRDLKRIREARGRGSGRLF